MKAGNKVAVGIVAAVAVGIGATAAIGGVNESPARAEELVPALASAQGAADRLPQDVDVTDQANLRPESSRLIGERDLASYWVARNDRDEICFVLRLAPAADGHPGDAGIMGVSCGTAAEFAEDGISLRLGGGDGGVVAHLLPPVVDAPAVKDAFDRAGGVPARALRVAALSGGSAGTEDSPVLVSMRTSTADDVGPVEVPRASGEPFVLPSMSGR